ncbi:hypothetical protein RND81_03G152700 [Saponaria officinalis]|uniref:Protein POLAR LOCALIZATION DURING ASYMMETRIC DIVISION AND REDISTRIBUTION n=1 Tax=Saponaria officinalis TaxID=3572 RepID=A0AAW1M8A0_SAPOF
MPAINSGEYGGGERCKAVLSREESVRGMECSRGLQCYSPARVAVCRLLAVVKKCKGRRRENSPVAEVEKREVSRVSIDHQRINRDVSGNQRQEMTFNLTVGLGLLSLIAASKTELEKTAELRQQMEAFLRSAKDEHGVKNSTPKQPEPEFTYAVSTTVDGLSNFSQEESGFSFVCDKHCDMYQTDRCVEGVNRLEEELEAELERMQFDIETEGYVATTEVSVNQEDTNESSSNGNATETVSSEEVTNPTNANIIAPEHSGVPPLELERRLHELLEARQEERIKELEAHLEIVKQKLQEKEVEAIWWKDTAKLISKQVPESSRAKVICDD